MKERLVCMACAAASLAAHAWLFSAGPDRASPRRAAPPLLMQLSVPEGPRAPSHPSQPPPEPKVEPASRPPVARAEPLLTRAPQKPPEAAPPELTGTTLTSDVDSTFSAPVGSGNERAGLLRTGAVSALAPAAVAPKTPAPSVPSRAPLRAEPTPLAQLSRKPAPPPLSDALERHYPTAARRLGRSGEASVRGLVEANGLLSAAQIKSESAAGFGAACRQALLGSRWTGPLDRDGRPVATYISYRCKFRSE